MATHTALIVDCQKVPNMAEPQAGNEHTIIYYQLDGNAASTYSVVLSGYPKTLAEAKHAIDTDVKQRDDLVAQLVQVG